jgi:hypothetical protein
MSSIEECEADISNLSLDETKEEESSSLIYKKLSEEEKNNFREQTLYDPTYRWFVIYIITNQTNNKVYVGQAISHLKIKTKKGHKYIPYGAEGRLNAHFRETTSNKKHQCTYLNNAIRQHGKESFTVEVLVECNKEEVDDYEIQFIKEHNSMFPEGYNIMRGGRKIEGYVEKGNVPRKCVSDEEKLNQSERTRQHNRKLKMDMCIQFFQDKPLLTIENYLKQGKDYDGFECFMLVIQKGCKTKQQTIKEFRVVFGGRHLILEESYKLCVQFYNELQENLAKHLVAGNSLESENTTTKE